MAGILFTSIGWGNFGLDLDESAEEVLKRRRKLKKSIATKSLVFMRQSHSDDVRIVTSRDHIGNGSHMTPVSADAIVSTEKNLSLAVLVGDCVPVLIHSKSAVAAIHVGRIGMTNGIIAKTLEALRSLESLESPVSPEPASAEKYEAILGPSICAKCYEVSLEMYQQVTQSFPQSATSEELHCLDLQSAITHQLVSEGVTVQNLGICTKESANHFSHRRSQINGEAQGRQVGVVTL